MLKRSLIIILGFYIMLVQIPLQASAQLTSQVISQNGNRLPTVVVNAIHKDLGKRFTIPLTNLKVKEAVRKNWADGCLELAEPDQFCTTAIVEGWRVTITDGSKTWNYRTNNDGKLIRLEKKVN